MGANYSLVSLCFTLELVLDLQTDTGVMSHWKDYEKLAVYTYLSHQPAAPFMTSNGSVLHVPMIPQIGTFRAGYLPKLNSQAVELPLSVSIIIYLAEKCFFCSQKKKIFEK